MSLLVVGAWFPDRPPTWIDVLVGAFAVGWVAFELVVDDPVVPAWLAVGFLAFVLAVGPVANSAVGARIGAWFRGIGVLGRATVIVGFAVAVVVVRSRVDVPDAAVTSFAGGIIGGVALLVALHLLQARTVEGWTGDRP